MVLGGLGLHGWWHHHQDPFPVPFVSPPSCMWPAGEEQPRAGRDGRSWGRAGGSVGSLLPPCPRGQALHPVPAAGRGKAGC